MAAPISPEAPDIRQGDRLLIKVREYVNALNHLLTRSTTHDWLGRVSGIRV